MPLNYDINLRIKARFQLENIAYTVYAKDKADKVNKNVKNSYFFAKKCKKSE